MGLPAAVALRGPYWLVRRSRGERVPFVWPWGAALAAAFALAALVAAEIAI